MKISIIGARTIGGTLGRAWVAAGHQVCFGVRNQGAAELQALLAELGAKAASATVAESIAFGDVVVLAVPGKAVAELVQANAAGLAGKVIIDAANNIGEPIMNAHKAVVELVRQPSYFRAFNSLGWENFANPRFGAQAADLFWCGPAGAGQQLVATLIRDVGLEPQYLGDVDQLAAVDGVVALWFALAVRQGQGRHLAFKVLRD